MRKPYRIASLILCAIFVFSALPAFAVTEASKQIRNYSIDASRDSDDIIVDFTIVANDTMDELGAESIVIYRKVGNHWVLEAEQNRNGAGMTNINSRRHSNTITYPADDGLEYKVVVTVFAENSDGYDSRSKTFYV